jgi:hypothetical protein
MLEEDVHVVVFIESWVLGGQWRLTSSGKSGIATR